MNVQVAQAKIKTDTVADIEAGARKLFAAIAAAHPEGIRYAWLLLPDGETFIALVQADDGVDNPIPDLPEYQELQEGLAGSFAEPPTRESWTVIASYRLFEA